MDKLVKIAHQLEKARQEVKKLEKLYYQQLQCDLDDKERTRNSEITKRGLYNGCPIKFKDGNKLRTAELRREFPLMHECYDEPCNHRIWVAVWKNEKKCGMTYHCPISDNEWDNVIKTPSTSYKKVSL
jgi:hypothetical protein